MGKKRERTDPEKVFANWNKTLGLFERGEYSLAIVRAAVTMELAANIVVRAELVKKRNLPVDFVDSLLKWSNGLSGKFDKLIYPILKGSPNYESFKSLDADWRKTNKERNGVAHSGDFKTKSVAEDILSRARKVVATMMSDYQPTLKFGKTQSEHRKHRHSQKEKKT
jgi:hypothetical protein